MCRERFLQNIETLVKQIFKRYNMGSTVFPTLDPFKINAFKNLCRKCQCYQNAVLPHFKQNR